MSKFIVGKEYISHNFPDFKMKVESRGTKYLSGTVYQTIKIKEWIPKKGKWEIVIKNRRYPFNKVRFSHSGNEDSIWFLMNEYNIMGLVKDEIRVGFVSN